MAKQKIIVLGGGMIGSAIAADLVNDYDVYVSDIDEERLNAIRKHHPVKIIPADLSSEKSIKNIVTGFDLVIGAVPGYMGFKTLKSVIEAKKNIVDISFFPEDPFELDELAVKNNVTAIVDCGIAPGFSSIVLGYHSTLMKIKNYECYVGGLPAEPDNPYKYKAPFSPSDVIEEYTRPVKNVIDGNIVVKEALTECEIMEFEYAGKLEAFNTDGLRTLLTTMKIPDMKEKTLRYPGHIEIIKVLKECGFFEKDLIVLDGWEYRVVDLTSAVLFPHWKLDEREKEFTVLKLIIESEDKRITLNLFDKYDDQTNTTSMARTTGYTCTAVSRLVLNNIYTKKGISPPEYVGMGTDCYEFANNYLKSKKINVKLIEENLS